MGRRFGCWLLRLGLLYVGACMAGPQCGLELDRQNLKKTTPPIHSLFLSPFLLHSPSCVLQEGLFGPLKSKRAIRESGFLFFVVYKPYAMVDPRPITHQVRGAPCATRHAPRIPAVSVFFFPGSLRGSSNNKNKGAPALPCAAPSPSEKMKKKVSTVAASSSLIRAGTGTERRAHVLHPSLCCILSHSRPLSGKYPRRFPVSAF